MSARVATIPAGQLYWDLLPAQLRRAARGTQDYQFEQVLPLSVETLQTARTALPDGRVLVVGIEPERLREHLLRLDSGQPWRLVPAALPQTFAGEGLPESALGRLDLLHGAFEPAPRRRMRIATAAVVVAGCVVVASAIVAGSLRRASAIERAAHAIEADADAVVAARLPAGENAGLPLQRLDDEIVRLEALQGEQTQSQRWRDVVPLLGALWSRWPRELRLRVEALTVTQERIVVRATLAGAADGERLAQALGGEPLDARRWRSDQLQVSRQDEGAQVVLTLLPEPAKP